MKKYFILAASALALAACTNDLENANVAVNDTQEAIKFTACVGALEETRAGQAIQSQAFDTGEEIYVECIRSYSDRYTDAATFADLNAIYVTGAAAGNVNALSLKVTDPVQDPFYWPARGTVSFKAFYPSTVTESTTSFSVSENQTGTAGYKGSDLMWATATGLDKTAVPTATVGLTFNHALSKIMINLTPGDGMTEADIAACTVTIHAKKTATIAEGVVSAATGEVTDIIAGVGAQNAAIIVPQTIDGHETAQNFITITTDGNHPVTYKIDSEQVFLNGKVYTYNFTVNMEAVTLQSTSINNWTAGDGGTSPGTDLTI